MQSQTLWTDLVDYARWAPSPHNVQPWKVKIISDIEAEVYFDPRRLLPVEDYTGCFMTVGFGIFIEMLSVAARYHGYTIRETFAGNVPLPKDSLTVFAKLTLKKTSEKPLYDRELIKERHTSRLPYDGKKLPEAVLHELQTIAKHFDHSFLFSSEPEMVDWVLRLNRDTIFYDMEDDDTRKEIGNWLRYNRNQAIQTKDGLWSYCMSTPGWLLYLFFHHRKLFNLPGINQYAKHFYLNTTLGTKTVGWLTGPFEKPEDWLKAGHMLAQLWMCLTKHGIYLHPFGSIITNKDSHKRMAEKFHITEGKQTTWLLMRLGYSKPPPKSLRLDTEEIII